MFFFVLKLISLFPSQDTLKYKINVDIQTVPFFAIDARGNPVFDLEKEDIQLFVNGKPYEIYYLSKTEIQERKEAPAVKSEVKRERAQQAAINEQRIKLIIIDTVFNSKTGIRRSKKIAVELVNNKSDNDRFIILLNTHAGIKYVIGPEANGEVIVRRIKKLNPLSDKYSKKIFLAEGSSNNWMISSDYDGGHSNMTPRVEKMSEELRYKTNVRRFSKNLAGFKSALRQITSAKIVFLFSEGIKKGAFLESISSISSKNKLYKTYLYEYLKEISKAINYGGGVLYTVNPTKVEVDDLKNPVTSGEDSLMYMAKEGGGKYFAGSDVNKIVSNIEKNTAAYYRLAFAPLPGDNNMMKIEIKPKREGVKIHTINYTEKTRPYIRMEDTQKKLFAYDVITGGNWSRMVGKVMRARFKKVKSGKKGNDNTFTVRVTLPEVMKDRKLDMFSIKVDTDTQKVNVSTMSRKIEDVLNLKFKRIKNTRQFFVIIEPTTPYCLYDEI